MEPTSRLSFNKQRCNSIHAGTIVNKGGDRLAVHQDLANILRSQPPITGILVPVAAGSVLAGSYFGVTAGVVLGMWPPFAPAPQSDLTLFFLPTQLFTCFPPSGPSSGWVSSVSCTLSRDDQVPHSCNTSQRKLFLHQP